jgi:type I restriction enzyme S subunit
MCDSGISSLGDIPTHWRVKRLKRITGRVDVGIAEAATHAYADEGVPMIRTTNVRPNQLLLDDLVHVESWFAATHRSKELFAGDLVTVRTGVPGTTAVVPRELNRSQCFTMLMATPRESQVPEFLSYYLNSGAARVYFEIEGLGTAQTNISVPILQQIQIPVPPKHEQHAIVTHIALEMARIERAVLKVELGIELLRESRAALMTAAVTGEIDVREEVA